MPKLTKRDKVAQALLSGRRLTGLDLVNEFHSTSYRDIIYDLRNRGMDISSVDSKHSDGLHKIWFMTDEAIEAWYDEEVV